METEIRDTIYALASGGGKSAVAVVRLSGPNVGAILRSVTLKDVAPRVATLSALRDPERGCVIDRGLVLWFPAPHSFTGEDSLEFQVHGSRAVVSAIIRMLARMDGVRLAEPGEFARRALENGKLDLIGVEALADLIDAETEEQRRLASVQASGGLRLFAERLRDEILDLMAVIETELDFSDEEDGSANIRDDVAAGLESIASRLAMMSANYHCVERIRDGLTVLIAGPTNAGKSSLLNAMARRDVAIVSEHAGTTRDMLEVRLDLGGFPVNLIDTAGMRSSNDPIEMEGIRRAVAKSSTADLVLWLWPKDKNAVVPPCALKSRPLWHIVTKADLASAPEAPWGSLPTALEVSVLTGQNLDLLIDRLKAFAQENMTVDSSAVISTERQRAALSSALKAIDAAKVDGLALEIVSEELRAACFALESLIGKVGVEDILDKLFSRFCIGK